MKLLSHKLLLVFLILFSGYGYMISCTRDNDMILPIETSKPPAISRGTNVHLPGNMTAGNDNEWAWYEIDDLTAYQYEASSTKIEVSIGLDYLDWIETGDIIRIGYVKGDSATHRLPGSGGTLPSYTLQ